MLLVYVRSGKTNPKRARVMGFRIVRGLRATASPASSSGGGGGGNRPMCCFAFFLFDRDHIVVFVRGLRAMRRRVMQRRFLGLVAAGQKLLKDLKVRLVSLGGVLDEELALEENHWGPRKRPEGRQINPTIQRPV